MFFQKIKGHEELLNEFKEWLLNDKFEGVYLFEGPKGVGKYSIAKTLAKYIVCPGVKDDSCNCENCKLFPAIPDYIEISSDEESVIKVSDIEAIEEFVTLMPFRGKNKVILIDDAERLNNSSASQLLKTLEDLKSHVIIFLISSYPERIIPTVLSRSKRIAFKQLHQDILLELLKEKNINVKNIEELNRIIPFLSKSILANYPIYSKQILFVQDFLLNFSKREEDEILSIINDIDIEGELVYFLEILLIYVCDILKIHFDDNNIIFNEGNNAVLDRMTIGWKSDICVAMLEKIRPIIKDYKKGINIKLKPRIASLMSWIFLMLKKEKKDTLNAG
jgi:DNA polymerase III delta prime subunit